MARIRWMALALAAGLACTAGGPASAGNAEDDTVRVRLVETKSGFRVVFAFRELTRNDKLTPPILARRLIKTKHSDGISGLALRSDGKKGPLRVVVKLKNGFANRILADGRGVTSFEYRIKDSCKRDRCGGPWGWADVTLRIRAPEDVSPN